MRLENWSVTGSADPYTPPEQQKRRLKGEVYGNPLFDEGERITTSSIHSVDGNVVATRNSVYTLGEPDPKFVEWCHENGHHVPTENQPLKMIITDFKLVDFDVMVLDDFLAEPCGDGTYREWAIGIGTDAESALDDLLESLSQYWDITGLEGRIKSEWKPSSEEGDCDITYYCLQLLVNEDE